MLQIDGVGEKLFNGGKAFQWITIELQRFMCAYVCMYVGVNMCICWNMCVYVGILKDLCVCMCLYVSKCVHKSVHVYIKGFAWIFIASHIFLLILIDCIGALDTMS